MILSTASLNQTPLDFEGNFRHIRDAIRAAKKQNSFLLVLPELCLSGCGCRNHFRRPEVFEQSLFYLEKLLPETEGITTTIGFPCISDGKTYNATAWVSDGFVEFIHLKTDFEEHLTQNDRSFDAACFDLWGQNRVVNCDLFGNLTHFGDFRFFAYDFSHQENPLMIQLKVGNFGNLSSIGNLKEMISREEQEKIESVDLIVHCGCVPFAFGRSERIKEKVRHFSRESDSVYLFSNHLGYESGEYIYDGMTLIAENGEIAAQSQRFSYKDGTILSKQQFRKPPEDDENKTESLSDMQTGFLPSVSSPLLYNMVWSKEEEFARAVPLALFDYLRKSRSQGFVLSLSGGADSGAVAVLVALMVHFAWNELGQDVFLKKLEHIFGDCGSSEEEAIPNPQPPYPTPQSAIRKLLTCVYQETRNNSETTQNAAAKLAESLGATFHKVSVDALVQNYTDLAASIFGQELSWEKNDLALQNIQARVRAPLAWFLANLKGALLLNTSNRSEATLGYATMDGDTCGALSPIGGIDKAFLQRWLRWCQTIGPILNDKRFPIPALRLINDLEPTAELRPLDRTQKDETDLMPYTVLNRLEKLLLKDMLPRTFVVNQLKKEFQEYSLEQLQHWTSKFLALWTRNQWKRKRYALSFYLDDDAPDPYDLDLYPTLCKPDYY